MKSTERKEELKRLSEWSIWTHNRLSMLDYKAHTLAYEIATAYGLKLHATKEGVRK